MFVFYFLLWCGVGGVVRFGVASYSVGLVSLSVVVRCFFVCIVALRSVVMCYDSLCHFLFCFVLFCCIVWSVVLCD